MEDELVELIDRVVMGVCRTERMRFACKVQRIDPEDLYGHAWETILKAYKKNGNKLPCSAKHLAVRGCIDGLRALGNQGFKHVKKVKDENPYVKHTTIEDAYIKPETPDLESAMTLKNRMIHGDRFERMLIMYEVMEVPVSQLAKEFKLTEGSVEQYLAEARHRERAKAGKTYDEIRMLAATGPRSSARLRRLMLSRGHWSKL